MKLVGLVAAVIGSVLSVSGAFAAVQSEPVSYEDGDTKLTGHIFWDNSIEGECPGVLVVKVTTHPKQAQEWSSATTANLDAWRQRAMKGLEQLSANPFTDTSRLAALAE